jgi:hypothetical protein
MTHITELINTDCYIDCGSNEKLREVVKGVEALDVYGTGAQQHYGIEPTDIYLEITLKYNGYRTFEPPATGDITHHINDIIF